MAVFTTITGTLGGNGEGLSGTIIAEIRDQLELSDKTIVPVGTIIAENVSGGTFSIEVPATDNATPASKYVYWHFKPDGAIRPTYLGRKSIPTSATAVDWADLT